MPPFTFSGDCFEDGVDYPGHDFAWPKVTSPADCQKECAKNAACNYWTYVRTWTACHLKRAKGGSSTTHNLDLISGSKNCGEYTYICDIQMMSFSYNCTLLFRYQYSKERILQHDP